MPNMSWPGLVLLTPQKAGSAAGRSVDTLVELVVCTAVVAVVVIVAIVAIIVIPAVSAMSIPQSAFFYYRYKI